MFPKINREHFLTRQFLVGLSVVILVIVVTFRYTEVGAAQVERATLMMNWLPQGQAVPFFVGLEKGIFLKHGIALEIYRGYGSVPTITAVDTKQMTFGYGEAFATIMANTKGVNVSIVSMLTDANTLSLGGLRERLKNDPRNLDGKKIGLDQGSIARLFFPVYARTKGFDPSKVEIVTMSIAVCIPAVLKGDIDGTSFFRGSNLQDFYKEAEKAKKELTFFDVGRDLGVYGIALFTSNSVIENNPDLVRRFVAATVESMEQTKKDPDAAAKALLKSHPELPSETTTKSVYEMVEDMQGPFGLGWIDKEKMTRTRDIVLEAYGIKDKLPLDKIYSTKFRAK